ncbi:hypothetical protein B0H14DRAFT_3489385 [Mycena olivaceomarginata]|nr:hypothetical protein B0H14DRAFT_3489385 [Mycena olivaceomarginata]
MSRPNLRPEETARKVGLLIMTFLQYIVLEQIYIALGMHHHVFLALILQHSCFTS